MPECGDAQGCIEGIIPAVSAGLLARASITYRTEKSLGCETSRINTDLDPPPSAWTFASLAHTSHTSLYLSTNHNL